MTKNKPIVRAENSQPLPHRRSIRLKGYDYSQTGTYFVTVCTHNKEYLFGDIVNGEICLNKYGRTIETEWLATPNLRDNVKLDTFIVMPNHFHGIILITRRGVSQYAPTFRSPSQTVGAVVRGFKSAVTKQINKMHGALSMPVWQRNYYEHIVRNEDKLNHIREYILNNPLQWQFDRENTERIPSKTYDDQWGRLEETIYGKAKK